MTQLDKAILIVDDDQEIRQLLAEFLTGQGFTVYTAGNGQEMWAELRAHSVDLIVLDLMLPGDSGFVLCKQIRERLSTPIVMLTAMSEENDRIQGLELGADDYLTKPFNPRELLARIKGILRRSNDTEDMIVSDSGALSHVLTFAGWVLEPLTRSLYDEHRVNVTLSTGEFDILLALAENAPNVLNRDQLMELTRNRSAGPFDRTIDMQISRLRQKIEDDPKKPNLIKTVRNSGYVLAAIVTKRKNI